MCAQWRLHADDLLRTVVAQAHLADSTTALTCRRQYQIKQLLQQISQLHRATAIHATGGQFLPVRAVSIAYKR